MMNDVAKNFEAKNKDWNLESVIYAFLDAEPEKSYLDISGQSLAICMEMLRARYLAINSKTHTIPKADFDDVFEELKINMAEKLTELFPDADDKQIRAMTSHLRGINYYPFRRALTEMCREIGFESKQESVRATKKATDQVISSFISTRNSLIHYGSFAVPENAIERWDEGRRIEAQWQQHQSLERFVAGVLAALLDFTVYLPEPTKFNIPDLWDERG